MWGTIQPVTCCTGDLLVGLSPLNWPVSYGNYGNWALQYNSEFPGHVQSNSPVISAFLLHLKRISCPLQSPYNTLLVGSRCCLESNEVERERFWASRRAGEKRTGESSPVSSGASREILHGAGLFDHQNNISRAKPGALYHTWLLDGSLFYWISGNPQLFPLHDHNSALLAAVRADFSGGKDVRLSLSLTNDR